MKKIENIEKTSKPESPIIRTEYNGVQVTITFDETAGDKNIKQHPKRFGWCGEHTQRT